MATSLWKSVSLSRNDAVSFRRPGRLAPAILKHTQMYKASASRIMETNALMMRMAGLPQEPSPGNNDIGMEPGRRGRDKC